MGTALHDCDPKSGNLKEHVSSLEFLLQHGSVTFVETDALSMHTRFNRQAAGPWNQKAKGHAASLGSSSLLRAHLVSDMPRGLKTHSTSTWVAL